MLEETSNDIGYFDEFPVGMTTRAEVELNFEAALQLARSPRFNAYSVVRRAIKYAEPTIIELRGEKTK